MQPQPPRSPFVMKSSPKSRSASPPTTSRHSFKPHHAETQPLRTSLPPHQQQEEIPLKELQKHLYPGCDIEQVKQKLLAEKQNQAVADTPNEVSSNKNKKRAYAQTTTKSGKSMSKSVKSPDSKSSKSTSSKASTAKSSATDVDDDIEADEPGSTDATSELQASAELHDVEATEEVEEDLPAEENEEGEDGEEKEKQLSAPNGKGKSKGKAKAVGKKGGKSKKKAPTERRVAADDDDYEFKPRKRKNPLDDDEVVDAELNIPLTEEQERVINLIVQEEKNVFFTGSAGTGKSFVLKHLMSRLRKKYPKGVFMTAATGIAAVNIGGVTLHSFAGIRLGRGSVSSLAENVARTKKYVKRWRQCKVLIIDEISMIDEALFSKLEQIARLIREVEKPFGGIQLVLCGDFFQLPPVKGKYAFEGPVWKQCVDVSVELTTVMRQKDDRFITILNDLRRGVLSDSAMLDLRNCCRPLDLSDGVIPTKLYTTNQSVDLENDMALNKLQGEAVIFESQDYGPDSITALLKDCPAKIKVTLKVGAQVVLLRKVESLEGLVNGSRGVVVGFTSSAAYARRARRFGEWYMKNPVLPVVRFVNGDEAAIPPIEFDVYNGEKGLRHQIPLKLAWALTVHRAQGMTLDRVECRLSLAFAPGQSYVALSRVRSLNGLFLRDFDRRALKVSWQVLQFYKKMQTLAAGGNAALPVVKTKIEMRRNNSGSIASFSDQGKMVVRPVGQRIINPVSPTFRARSINPSSSYSSSYTSSSDYISSSSDYMSSSSDYISSSSDYISSVSSSSTQPNRMHAVNKVTNNIFTAVRESVATTTTNTFTSSSTTTSSTSSAPSSPSPLSLTYRLPTSTPTNANDANPNLTLYKQQPNGHHPKPSNQTQTTNNFQSTNTKTTTQQNQQQYPTTKPNGHSHTKPNGSHPPSSSSSFSDDPTWAPVHTGKERKHPSSHRGRANYADEDGGGTERSSSRDTDSIFAFLNKIKI